MKRGSYSLLPEWAPQDCVILTWPHRDSDWAPWLPQVEMVYSELATRISHYEDLLIICQDTQHIEQIRQRLQDDTLGPTRIHYHALPTNDTWVRDYGPISLIQDQQAVLLNFAFNGWGAKHSANLDNQVSQRLHQCGAFPRWSLKPVDFVLEGGSIDGDGDGTIMTTTACLLNSNRNPGYSRKQIEQLLLRQLGATRILWLEQGHIIGDDTDGHIDMLARFCDPQTIAYANCENPEDVHFSPLHAMELELRTLRTRNNTPYQLVPLPLPAPLFNPQGQRLPASYANFLIINQAVLVPVYDDPADAQALTRLAACFPGREIIAIPCRPLLLQQGSLHCATMQIPLIPDTGAEAEP